MTFSSKFTALSHSKSSKSNTSVFVNKVDKMLKKFPEYERNIWIGRHLVKQKRSCISWRLSPPARPTTVIIEYSSRKWTRLKYSIDDKFVPRIHSLWSSKGTDHRRPNVFSFDTIIVLGMAYSKFHMTPSPGVLLVWNSSLLNPTLETQVFT